MSPTLKNNDYVLCGLWPGYGPVTGCLVVVAHPLLKVIVKRVLSVDEQGKLQLSGDNIASISTESMGWVDKKHLLGRVFFRISA